MPIYEYKCNDCGNTFEKLVKNNTESVNCIQCGSEKIEKLLSVFSASSDSTPDCPASSVCPSGGCCSSGGGCPMSQ